MVPPIVSHPIPWGSDRRTPVAGAIRHAMGEKVVVPNKGIFDAEVLHEKSPELFGKTVSAHRYLRPDGTIVVSVGDDRVAWHAGESKLGELVGLNASFLGLEWLVPGEWDIVAFNQAMLNGSAKFTEEQYDSGGWQYAQWMQTYNFSYPMIVDHRTVAGDDVRGLGKGKLDPGNGFNHGKLTDAIRRHLDA